MRTAKQLQSGVGAGLTLFVRVCLYRRFLFFIACIAVVGGSGVLAQARSLEEVQKTKEIRICLVPDPTGFTVEPPDCRENCKFGGNFYELAPAFAATLGSDVKAKVLRVEWDEQFFDREGKTVRENSYTPELLASGKCDVYANGLTKLPWREKKLAFVTLHPTRMMVVTNRSTKAALKSPKDLCGKTAATIKDTSYQTWLQGQNESACAANLIRIRLMTFEEASKAVDTGGVDFIVQNIEETMWLDSPFKNSVTAFPVGPIYEQGWAFRKEDKDLQAAAETFFEAQKAQKDSLLNKQWKNFLGMTLPEYIERVPK